MADITGLQNVANQLSRRDWFVVALALTVSDSDAVAVKVRATSAFHTLRWERSL